MRTVLETESLRTEVAEATLALSVSFPCPQASEFYSTLDKQLFKDEVLFVYVVDGRNKQRLGYEVKDKRRNERSDKKRQELH